MMSSVVRIENDGGIRIIELNRPHRMNAFDLDMCCALRDAIRVASADVSVRVLVLGGAGGNFCTGADLRRDRSKEQQANIDLVDVLQEAFLLLRYGAKPSVAAISGFAMGAGLSLALACDFIIAEESARLGASFTSVGLAPDIGIALTLPERVGVGVARDMLLSCSMKSAAEALAIGLIDAVCGPGECLQQAIGKARVLSERAPLAVAAARSLLAGPRESCEAFLRTEKGLQQTLRNTRDAREAAAAFAEKRRPVFHGH